MIRLYLALGVLAAFVALGGYALLERSWRQVEAQKVSALKADLANATLAIEAEKTKAARAARIAASTAEEAKNLTVEVRRLREVHRDITTIFHDEPSNPACDCSLSPGVRERLLRIPVRPPAPRPVIAPPATPRRSDAPMQGPGR